MKYLPIWLGMIAGNVLYQALFAETLDYRTAMNQSIWQGSALLAAWIFD